MSVFLLLLPALVAALFSFLLTPLAMRLAFRVGAIDKPDERKVHLTPIPRLGGLAVVGAVAVTLGLTALIGTGHAIHYTVLVPLFLAVIPVFVISVIDDIRSVSSFRKFSVHLLGAIIAVALGFRVGGVIHAFGGQLSIGILAIPLSIFWIAGVTNAFNLVDGLDGLSGGLALISSISLAAVSLLSGRYEMATAAFIIAGALVGFLPFNTHPAKVFLGDSGSASIGFMLACLALRGGSTLSAGMAILVPIVVLGVPIAETLVSMMRRLLRRFSGDSDVRIFTADRRHFHHRLLDMGIDHRRAVLMLYGVGIVLAVCGYVSMLLTAKWAAVLLGSLIVAAFIGIGRLGYDEFAIIKNGVALRVYDVPMLKSALFVVFIDIALGVGATYSAIVLKYDDWGLTLQRPLAQQMLITLPPSMLVVFSLFRMYRGAWKLASLHDFLRSSAAVLVTSALAFIAIAVVFQNPVSLTFAVIFLLMYGLLTTSGRLSYRMLSLWTQRTGHRGEHVLIYGAGAGGVMALRELLSNQETNMKPIGFLDDDPRTVGRLVQGYPVYGGGNDLLDVIRKEDVRGIVVSSSKIGEQRLRTLRLVCEGAGIWLQHFTVSLVQYEHGAGMVIHPQAPGWPVILREPGKDHLPN